MRCGVSAEIASSMSILYQSAEKVKPGTKDGWRTTPITVVLAISGVKSRLPMLPVSALREALLRNGSVTVAVPWLDPR